MAYFIEDFYDEVKEFITIQQKENLMDKNLVIDSFINYVKKYFNEKSLINHSNKYRIIFKEPESDYTPLYNLAIDINDKETNNFIKELYHAFVKNQNEVNQYWEEQSNEDKKVVEFIQNELQDILKSNDKIDTDKLKVLIEDRQKQSSLITYIFDNFREKINKLDLHNPFNKTYVNLSTNSDCTLRKYNLESSTKKVENKVVTVLQTTITESVIKYLKELKTQQSKEINEQQLKIENDTVNTLAATYYNEYQSIYGEFSCDYSDVIYSLESFIGIIVNKIQINEQSYGRYEVQNFTEEQLKTGLKNALKILKNELIEESMFYNNLGASQQKLETLIIEYTESKNPFKQKGLLIDILYCYKLIFKHLEHEIKFTSKLPIEYKALKIDDYNYMGIYDFNLELEEIRNFITKILDTHVSKLVEEFKSKLRREEDPEYLKEIVYKDVSHLLNSKKTIVEDETTKILPFKYFIILKNRFIDFKSITPSDLINAKGYKNDTFHIMLQKFEPMLERYKQGCTISTTQTDSHLKANCLPRDIAYIDEEYIYTNVFYGAQVYREHNSLKLKVSHDANIESKLSSEEIEKRLAETYDFFTISKLKEDRFNEGNTVNITKKTYTPTFDEYYIDPQTHEVVKNEFAKDNITKQVSNTNKCLLPVITKLITSLLKDDKESLKKHDEIISSFHKNIQSPDFILLFYPSNTLGEAVLQYYQFLLKEIFGDKNCYYIDGIELLEPLSDQWKENTIVFIDNLPTTLTENQKQVVQKNISRLELEAKEHNLIVIKSTEVAPLSLHKNQYGYCAFDCKSDFSDTNYLGFKNKKKLFKAIKEEIHNYLNYLNTIENKDNSEIEVLENDFTEYLKTVGNRVQAHVKAHMSSDIEFFSSLELSDNASDRGMLAELKKCFNHRTPYISQQLMIDIFLAMEQSSVSRADVLNSFKAEAPEFFSIDKSNNAKQPNSDERFFIRSQYNKEYKGEVFDRKFKTDTKSKK